MNRGLVFLLLVVGLVGGVVGGSQYEKRWGIGALPVSAKVVEDKFASGVTARGFFRDGRDVRVLLSDGRIAVADAFRETSTGWQARLGDLWYRGDQQ